MTNQPDPVIDAVQDRHVESIILSGSPFVSAILGPGAYRIAADAIPVFYTNPVITGSIVPPSELLCGEGSFNSSPRATITYQWKSNGVDIGGETNNTLATFLNDIGKSFTCEVTITNPSGSDTALSNALVMAAITEGFVYELGAMAITGLSSLWRMDMNDMDMIIVSGLTGPARVDENTLDMYVVTGIHHIDKIDVNESDIYAVSGMANIDKIDIYEEDTYAMFNPIYLTPLVVVNGDAENSNMSDWTMDVGNVQSVTTAPGRDITINREGLRFFKADDLGQGVDSQMSQEITIPGADLADIDTGRCYCVANFIHQSDEGWDRIDVQLEAIDANPTVLETTLYESPFNPENLLGGAGWMHQNTGLDEALHLPTLTRVVKITVFFKASGSGSAANNAYIDDIQIELMKV